MSKYLLSTISIIILLWMTVENVNAQDGALLETIEISDSVLNDSNGIFTNTVLENGVAYLIEVSGSFNPWCPDTSDTRVNRDAKYEYFAVNGFLRFPGGLDNNSWLGNLRIRGETIDWGNYNLQHTYQITYIGKGQQINFWVYDDVYGDDCGVYTIKLYTTNITDTTPPTTAISTNPAAPDGNNGWFKTAPLITLSRSEPGNTYWSYVQGYSFVYSTPFSVQDGQYTIYYYSVDTSGNPEQVKQQFFKIDTIPPAIIKNIALNKSAYANSSWNSTPANAFDGDKSIQGLWNSGTYAPAWIYVDLQQSYDIGQIRLRVDQFPDGDTVHNIYTSQDGSNWTLVKTFNGYTYMLQNLTASFSPSLSNVRYVRVETTDSPSWVAWNEIEVYETLHPVSPADSATGVNISTNITATFSEDMDPSTINSSTFYLRDNANNLVSGTVSYNSSTMTATFNPVSNLGLSSTFTATITTGVKDLAGNNMTSNMVWSFTTSSSQSGDTTPPTTTASPLGGTYPSAQNITLTCNDGGGSGCQTTRYCLGAGCTPSTTYSGAINIPSSNTLRFYSTDNSNNNETVKSEVYTINLTGQNERVDLSYSIHIIFSQVSDLCNSSASIVTNSYGSAPSGYKFMGKFYDVTTCADYTGTISVTIPYTQSSVPSGKEGTLRMFHWENGAWHDVTVSVDTGNNTITGRVTSLSPFGMGYSTSSGSGSGSGSGSSTSTGANENMIALIAILAISAGIFLIRKNKWIQTK
jgi:hypothetical protein